jgi:hypothetical protein
MARVLRLPSGNPNPKLPHRLTDRVGDRAATLAASHGVNQQVEAAKSSASFEIFSAPGLLDFLLFGLWEAASPPEEVEEEGCEVPSDAEKDGEE